MKLRPGTPEEVGMSVERVQRVVELAEGWVTQGITPALVILAARRGVILIHEAFGRLTPEEASPPLPVDTIFPISSLTKPITATLAMSLVEDGLLGLSRPVSRYIPEFVTSPDDVMVHHLLTHTSGIRQDDVRAHSEEKKGTVKIPPPDETQHPGINEELFLGYDVPLWKPPGAEMSYCNYNYTLLGEVVRRVSGSSLDNLARERVFRPLGMKNTWFIVPESVGHRIIKRSEDGPFPELNSRLHQEIPSAAAGVYSTAMDMAIFGQMFLNRGIYGDTRILSPATVTEMTRNHIPGISARWGNEVFPEASWGLGWSVRGNNKSIYSGALNSPESIGHGGAGSVALGIDPTYEMVMCYFCIGFSQETFYIDLFQNSVMAGVVDV